MKAAIGSDGNNLNSTVAKRFGHAEYFIVYDTATNEFEPKKNIDEDHSHGNLNELVDDGVEVFIVGNIGPHSFAIIKERGCRVFLARNMPVEEAVAKFVSNQLKELTEPTVKKSIGHDHSHH